MVDFPWRITGTDEQQAIARETVDAIKFPWQLLKFGRQPELGWRNLNDGSYSLGSVGHNHEPDSYNTIEVLLNGRKYILGVYYPGSATIFIDNALVGGYSHYARSTISAELAHGIDDFLMTDTMRNQLISLHHGGKACPDNHSWWEKFSYSTEYRDLIGESFMIDFTKGYSDIVFGNPDYFTHSGANITADQIRAVLGIQRTDYAEPIGEPPQPAPTHAHSYHNFPPSKIVHKPKHYDHRATAGRYLDHIPSDYRGCKICKPH